MSYKWNALWIVSIAVFVAFFLSYQFSIESDRSGLRPEGIKIIYTENFPIHEVQFYVDTTNRPHTIRFESVSDVDLSTKAALVAVVLPYRGIVIDHSNWHFKEIGEKFVFAKEYNCTEENPCIFTENNQFFSFGLDELIDQKKGETHKISIQFLDTAASSEVKNFVSTYYAENLPLDNSFELESSKITVFINEASDDIEPLPATPIRFGEVGNRLVWEIESGILHQLKWENPVERKQIFDMVLYSAVYGIALAILNLIMFAWSQRIKVLSLIKNKMEFEKHEKGKVVGKIIVTILILIAVIVSSLLGAYLSNPYLFGIIVPQLTDDDEDGIPNNVDSCPDQPETLNDFRDSDGCPDKKFPPPNQILTSTGDYKISLIKEIVTNPQIVNSLRSDNEKYISMQKPYSYMLQKEIEWVEAGGKLTPFMRSFIDNHASEFLNGTRFTPSENFGEIVFGELILTNSFGANTAITTKTDNFDQGSEEWWQITEQHGLYVKSCEWDDSAVMWSEDISIRIDDNGKILGVLNVATPCDVLEK